MPGRAVGREPLSDEGEHGEKRDEQDRRLPPWECLETCRQYGNRRRLCRVCAGFVPMRRDGDAAAMHRSVEAAQGAAKRPRARAT